MIKITKYCIKCQYTKKIACSNSLWSTIVSTLFLLTDKLILILYTWGGEESDTTEVAKHTCTLTFCLQEACVCTYVYSFLGIEAQSARSLEPSGLSPGHLISRRWAGPSLLSLSFCPFSHPECEGVGLNRSPRALPNYFQSDKTTEIFLLETKSCFPLSSKNIDIAN